MSAVCPLAALRQVLCGPPAGSGRAYLRDLLANAARRIAGGRHDDAVARLYCAIEKSAKIRLMAAHGTRGAIILAAGTGAVTWA